MRIAAALAFSLTACAHLAAGAADIEAVARVAIASFDPAEKVELLFAPEVPAETRRIVSNVRKERRPVADDELQYVPEGVFRLDSIEVSGDQATVKGLLGPVPRPRPGVVLLACGTRYTIELKRAGETWEVSQVAIAVC